MTPEQQLQIQSAETLSELRLIEIIREQESELKAGAHMLAEMHDENFDLQKRITALCVDVAALKARLKPVEEVYSAMKTLLYDKRGFIVDDKTEDIKIPEVVWHAIKSASEKDTKNG